MELQLNEQLVVAESQKHLLDEAHQLFNEFKFIYTVKVKDQDGKLVKVNQVIIEKEEYNTFCFDGYDSFKSIAEHYKAKYGYALSIPNDFDASLRYVAPPADEPPQE